MTQITPDATKQTKSTCYMCFNACGIVAHTQGNRVLRIEGDPDNPQNHGQLCLKGRAGLYGLDNPHRITTPLRRTNPEKGIGVDPRWEPLPWEEALTVVADRLKAILADDPRKLVGIAFDAHVYTQFMTWLAAFGSPVLAAALGFKWGFWTFGVLLLVWLAVFWLKAENAPRRAPAKSFSEVLKPLKDSKSWMLSLYYFLTFGGFVAMAHVSAAIAPPNRTLARPRCPPASPD